MKKKYLLGLALLPLCLGGCASSTDNLPYVKDGYWWVGDSNTGLPTAGEKGDIGATGKDGTTPHIGDNGNWFIGDTDTGVPATGGKGDTGQSGKDGNPGKDGQDGKSAYQSWLDAGHEGTEEDFLQWLKDMKDDGTLTVEKEVIYCSHGYYAKTETTLDEETTGSSLEQTFFHYKYLTCDNCEPLCTSKEASDETQIGNLRKIDLESRLEEKITKMNANGWVVKDYTALNLPCSSTEHSDYASGVGDPWHTHYKVTYTGLSSYADTITPEEDSNEKWVTKIKVTNPIDVLEKEIVSGDVLDASDYIEVLSPSDGTKYTLTATLDSSNYQFPSTAKLCAEIDGTNIKIVRAGYAVIKIWGEFNQLLGQFLISATSLAEAEFQERMTKLNDGFIAEGMAYDTTGLLNDYLFGRVVTPDYMLDIHSRETAIKLSDGTIHGFNLKDKDGNLVKYGKGLKNGLVTASDVEILSSVDANRLNAIYPSLYINGFTEYTVDGVTKFIADRSTLYAQLFDIDDETIGIDGTRYVRQAVTEMEIVLQSDGSLLCTIPSYYGYKYTFTLSSKDAKIAVLEHAIKNATAPDPADTSSLSERLSSLGGNSTIVWDYMVEYDDNMKEVENSKYNRYTGVTYYSDKYAINIYPTSKGYSASGYMLDMTSNRIYKLSYNSTTDMMTKDTIFKKNVTSLYDGVPSVGNLATSIKTAGLMLNNDNGLYYDAAIDDGMFAGTVMNVLFASSSYETASGKITFKQSDSSVVMDYGALLLSDYHVDVDGYVGYKATITANEGNKSSVDVLATSVTDIYTLLVG